MASSGGSKPRTRNTSGCKMSDYVGAGKEFAVADVPTNRADIRRGLLLREQKLYEEGIPASHYPAKVLARDLAPLVEQQWQKANGKFVPPLTVSTRRVEKKIEDLWEKVKAVAYGRGKASERAKVD